MKLNPENKIFQTSIGQLTYIGQLTLASDLKNDQNITTCDWLIFTLIIRRNLDQKRCFKLFNY